MGAADGDALGVCDDIVLGASNGLPLAACDGSMLPQYVDVLQ